MRDEIDPIQPPPDPTPPRLPGRVVLRPEPEDVYTSLMADMCAHAVGCVRAFGDFHLALSGGSTPLPLYRQLMTDPMARGFPWARTHLWIVDERRVPFEDERSNFGQIRDLLVEHSGIPAEQVHPIRATEPDADLAYERELRETLAWREKGHDRLDFVLLGMGADAHTASLFPRSPALDAGPDRLVVFNAGPRVTPPDRVTMTYRLLNASRFIAVLAVGASKRDTLARVAARSAPAADLPILGIEPLGGELRWYLDFAACAP
ncbi:MAG: 6-phosphogluconolactonase [Phycisphaerae bacterium]|nr:6-phosphogluconolactonase [Phycisphaerae bacterium]